MMGPMSIALIEVARAALAAKHFANMLFSSKLRIIIEQISGI